LIVMPPVLLMEAGSLDALVPVPPLGWYTVVVVFEVLPLAMISAITPPATAPPMTGIHRLKSFMFDVSPWEAVVFRP
jgi:hypothetical protein